jgi:hypothetical protein
MFLLHYRSRCTLAAFAVLGEIYNARGDRQGRGRDQGELDYGAKYPKAVARIVDDADDAAAAVGFSFLVADGDASTWGL